MGSQSYSNLSNKTQASKNTGFKKETMTRLGSTFIIISTCYVHCHTQTFEKYFMADIAKNILYPHIDEEIFDG